MPLSDESRNILCGLAVAGGAVMLGAVGVHVATGVVELVTNGGNLALATQRERQDRCHKLVADLTKALETNYEKAWHRRSDPAAVADEQAAFQQLDIAIPAMRPTTQDIADAGFNAAKLYNTLKAKLPEKSEFRTNAHFETVLQDIITGSYLLIRSDKTFAAEFQALGFENVFKELNKLKYQGKEILDAVKQTALEATLREHRQEEAAALRHKATREFIQKEIQSINQQSHLSLSRQPNEQSEEHRLKQRAICDPENKQAHEAVGRYLMSQGRLEDARIYLERSR
ncbi:MAG: hypothetical protein AAF590_08770 [Pseudomonadota bacterium]